MGVVAAITLPNFMKNTSENVRNRQIEVFKQKLVQSTSKMNAMGQMIPYDTTDKFVNEFSKHYKIIQKCSNEELEKCWPSKVINVPNSSGILFRRTDTSNRNCSVTMGCNAGCSNMWRQSALCVGD